MAVQPKTNTSNNKVKKNHRDSNAKKGTGKKKEITGFFKNRGYLSQDFVYKVFSFLLDDLTALGFCNLVVTYKQAWPESGQLQLQRLLSIPVDRDPRTSEDWQYIGSFSSKLEIQMQITALVKKNKSKFVAESSIQELSSTDSCMLSFLQCEAKNKETNSLFREFNKGTDNVLTRDPAFEQVLLLAKRKIALVLGSVPSIRTFDLEFGPGSSTSVKKTTTARYKLMSPPICSKEAYHSGAAYAFLCVTALSWLKIHDFKLYLGMAQLSFVDKEVVSDRTVIIEPIVNTSGQKAIGKVIKQRLLDVGVSLKDQTINQQFAISGSNGGAIATLDLKNASNTLAYAVVLELLPPGWFKLLSDWRTGTYECRKYGIKSAELEMFSSMGNGFTFELESLIFYAICWASIASVVKGKMDKIVSVFGDDLIIPLEYAEVCIHNLQLFGFTINREKSCINGNFRESCGAYFYRGRSVVPFFIKDEITYARMVGFYNFLAVSKEHSELTWCKRAQDLCLQSVPFVFRRWGPRGFGDGHFVFDRSISFFDLKQSQEPYYEIRSFTTFVQEETYDGKQSLKSPLTKRTDCLLPLYTSQIKSGRYILSSSEDLEAKFDFLRVCGVAPFLMGEGEADWKWKLSTRVTDPFKSNHRLKETVKTICILACQFEATL